MFLNICLISLTRPKKDNHTKLDEYKRAEQIGIEHGDCWSFYPGCPHSIFNFIPGTENSTLLTDIGYVFKGRKQE